MRRNQFRLKKFTKENLNIRKEVLKMFEFVLAIGAISIFGLTIINLYRLRQDKKNR